MYIFFPEVWHIFCNKLCASFPFFVGNFLMGLHNVHRQYTVVALIEVRFYVLPDTK